MKKIIVLQHNEGQLANQLWLFSHLLSYALEKNYDIDIWCFYQYSKFFDTPFPKNKFIKFIFYKTFPTFVFKNKNLFRLFRKIYRIIYKILIIFPIKILYKKNIIDSSKKQYVLDNDSKKDEIIKKFENDPNFNLIFTLDWNFLAYSYLEKHREKIISMIKPKNLYLHKVNNLIKELKKQYKFLIGVHLRQWEPGDGYDPNYIVPNKTKIYIEEKDWDFVFNFFNQYLQFFNKNPSETVFILCSNREVKLEMNKHKSLNFYISKGNLIEDLLTLSKCDIILGCNSSYCAFASYFGNIPLIVFQDPIDWDYYKDKDSYFRNKYCTAINSEIN
jgi:organic radical activating enzyme